MLLLMGVVVQMFSAVGDSVNNSRSTLEATDRLRATATRLQMDLQGLTVLPIPPRRPDDGGGYLEVIEGPVSAPAPAATATDRDTGGADSTVGDVDDILMFTTHTTNRPFVGLYNGAAIQSDTAEVAWFLRGNTLYRRVLLVMPGVTMPAYSQDYFEHYDISARTDGSTIFANTLGDLTKRENRFAHDTTFPFAVAHWDDARLPTLGECAANWLNPAPVSPNFPLDYWGDPPIVDTGARANEDVILTNVIGFDVKVFDPMEGTYVDLGTGAGVMTGLGEAKSGLSTGSDRVYCTWSFHYEHDGIRQPTAPVPVTTDAGTNGFDDPVGGSTNGIVDDIGERETMAPYPVQLRGIQVKIRIFEPDSRQIREVTVVQDFLPK